MDALKKILINHGEKILLAIIGLLCLGSIFSRISRPKDELLLPNGGAARIDRQRLSERLAEVDKLFKSSGEKRQKPSAEKISQKFAGDIFAGLTPIKRAERYEWFAYCQPAPIGIPQSFREPPQDPDEIVANIPAEYRTRLGNAEDVKVRAAIGQVMITARDSQYLNFPQPGSRQMLVYRKAIGSAKSDLAPELRAKLKDAPRTSPVVEVEETAENSAKSTSAGVSRRATSLWGSAAQTASTATTTVSSSEKFSRKQYEIACNRQDIQADKELDVITGGDNGLLLESGWELLTDNMFVVKNGELTDEDVAAIFANGVSPELVVMTAEQQAEYEKQEKERKGKEASKKDDLLTAKKDSITTSLRGSTGGRAKPKEIVAKQTQKTEEVSGEIEDSSPRQYVFVDKNVKENMIYRYAVLAGVKPRRPQESEVKDLDKWDIYCELVGIDTPGCFAPPQRKLRDILFADTPADGKTADNGKETVVALRPELALKREKGILAPHLLNYIKPAYSTASVSEVSGERAVSVAKDDKSVSDTEKKKVDVLANGPQALSLRGENNRLNDLGWAYKNQETCFSDFVCSDLILTPNEFDFALVNALPKSDNSDANARIEVFKIEKNGDVVSATFTVKSPELPRQVGWQDFLAKGPDGKKFLRPIQFLSLSDIYNRSEFAKVVPVAIGQKARAKRVTADGAVSSSSSVTPISASRTRQTPLSDSNAERTEEKTQTNAASREEVDFSNNWGVIDIRPYKIRQRIFIKDKNGNWKLQHESLQPLASDFYSVVIAEIKTKPGETRRVRRLFRPLPVKADTENKKYQYEYVPEYELEKQVRAQEKKEAGARTPAAGNTGKK